MQFIAAPGQEAQDSDQDDQDGDLANDGNESPNESIECFDGEEEDDNVNMDALDIPLEKMDIEDAEEELPRSHRARVAARNTSERRGTKVTEGSFTPRTRQLVVASKQATHVSIAMDNPFPLLTSEKMHKEFMWEIIKSAWYGKAGGFCLLGGLGTSQIEEKVSWLLKGGKFKYGELDYQNKKYNVNGPFGNQVFSDIIWQIWFNKEKADAGAFLTMLKNQQISESLLLLVVTSIYSPQRGLEPNQSQMLLVSSVQAKISCISELEGVNFDVLESIATGSEENNGPTNILQESDPFM
ncbi:hypothetical protein BDZ94DRAFT_1242034 [Collybia nuda]|uniref:DUF6532 domain-containing protein n=1 Tax=Collybia nuda TaxID=64659 RepID=A0A9P5XQL1_9AGAR|nr:hypothetical protein BDZ94DRAFT_1242034 [Collybia nuda]